MRELEHLMDSISTCNTITLSTLNSSLKTSALLMISQHFCSANKPVYFHDLDLQFSSMVANFCSIRGSLERLVTYCPKETEVMDTISSFLSQESLGSGGAIIIDSVNSLQDLLGQGEGEADTANHKASIILTLFQELAQNNSMLLFLSNIVRSRPSSNGGGVAWQKELVGGRMIKLKSDVLLSINESGKGPNSAEAKLEVLSVSGKCKTNLKKGQVIELSLEKLS